MFTGIIEEIGIVKSIRRGSQSSRLEIQGEVVMGDLKIGDSVAVNGVCLTAETLTEKAFFADVMAETLRRSSLGDLTMGSSVNLERAMPADGRFGGHIVSGHIDGTGTIRSMKREDNAVIFTVNAPASVLKYIVEKGSIAIDGVSLTVMALDSTSFSVSLIPHTSAVTILLKKKPGDVVNLECDVIGKYVERLLSFKEPSEEKSSGVSLEFLMKNGF